MTKIKNLFLIGAVMISNGLFGSCHAHDAVKGIVVRNAWIRTVAPTQNITAAYMTIQNQTDQEIVLQSVNTDIAEIVEIHKMEHADGMMKMEKVDNIRIPIGKQVALEPGGFHLMLINLVKPIQEGDHIFMVLNFQDGLHVTADTIVQKEEDQGTMGHRHHHY